jgi:hypothetical protein
MSVGHLKVIRSMSPIIVSPVSLMLAGMVMKYFKTKKEEDIKRLTYRKIKNNIDEYLLTYKQENEELYSEIMSMRVKDEDNI